LRAPQRCLSPLQQISSAPLMFFSQRWLRAPIVVCRW
jgi:hypothetical protein